MTCPFNKESLAQLKAFIDFCTSKPDVLHSEDLAFFKNYLESLGATIPPVPKSPTKQPKADNEPKPQPETMEEQIESDPESDLEFDMEGCLEPDVVNPEQVMGDPEKAPTEEEMDQADEKRIEAMSQFSEGNFEKAVELYTEAIVLNPAAAVLYVKRGQTYLKLNKPNACIKDCTHALELNPDSAPGYKFRGRAQRLLANWQEAAKDLRQACKIDFDEQADDWLREVTPNAQKIEQHNLKQERKKYEKEQKEKAEKIRRAKEAHAKASKAGAESQGTASGEAGPGAAGLGDFYKLLQDPDVISAFQDPEVAAAFQDISVNPSNFVKYQSNPKIMDLITKLSGKFQGPGMNFPGFPGAAAGGFPGFPGTGGFGKESGGGPTRPSEDDGLD